MECEIGNYEEALQIKNSYENSQLVSETKTQHIKLAPKYLGNIKSGIKQHLSTLMCRFDQKFDGIPVAYRNIKLHQIFGKVISDQSCIHFDVTADFIIFRPTVGCKLKGKVNKIGKRHLGCLVHGQFNAWVPLTSQTEKIEANKVMGSEMEFTVQEISINRNLLYLKGKFEKFLSESLEDILLVADTPDTGQSNQKRKKKASHGANSSLNNSQINRSIDEHEDSVHKTTKKHRKGVKIAKESSEIFGSITDNETHEMNKSNDSEQSPKLKKKRKKDKRRSEQDSDLVDKSVDTKHETEHETESEHLSGKRKKHKKDKRKSKELEAAEADGINDSVASTFAGEPLLTSTQIEGRNLNNQGDNNSVKEAPLKKHKKKKRSESVHELSVIMGEEADKTVRANGLDVTIDETADQSADNTYMIHAEMKDSDFGKSVKESKSRKRHLEEDTFTSIKLKHSVIDNLEETTHSPAKKHKKHKKINIEPIENDSLSEFQDSLQTSKSPNKERKKKKKHKKEHVD